MSRGKAMVISHSFAFLLGVTCAKLHDREELNSYRNAYEGNTQRLRRYAGNAVMATIAIGSIWMVARIGGGPTDNTATRRDLK